MCGETPRMKTPNNMNVQAEQNAAASASAASTTASTAAAQAHQQITSFFGRAHTSSAQEAAAPAPAAVDLTVAGAAGTTAGANMSASASPQQQPVAGSLSAARATLVWQQCITPSCITPQSTRCGCSDVPSHPLLSHILVYHTPIGAPASCTLSPGVHKTPHPPQEPHPVIIIMNSKMLSLGCGILCHIRSC